MAAVAERQPSLFKPGPYMPARFMVPVSPALDDPGGLFMSPYQMPIMVGGPMQPPFERRSGQLDESR